MDEYYFDGNRGYRINYRSDYIVDNGYENHFENVNNTMIVMVTVITITINRIFQRTG